MSHCSGDNLKPAQKDQRINRFRKNLADQTLCCCNLHSWTRNSRKASCSFDDYRQQDSANLQGSRPGSKWKVMCCPPWHPLSSISNIGYNWVCRNLVGHPAGPRATRSRAAAELEGFEVAGYGENFLWHRRMLPSSRPRSRWLALSWWCEGPTRKRAAFWLTWSNKNQQQQLSTTIELVISAVIPSRWALILQEESIWHKQCWSFHFNILFQRVAVTATLEPLHLSLWPLFRSKLYKSCFLLIERKLVWLI